MIPRCPDCGNPRYALGDPPSLRCPVCIVRHIEVRREAGLSPYVFDRKPSSGIAKKRAKVVPARRRIHAP